MSPTNSLLLLAIPIPCVNVYVGDLRRDDEIKVILLFQEFAEVKDGCKGDLKSGMNAKLSTK